MLQLLFKVLLHVAFSYAACVAKNFYKLHASMSHDITFCKQFERRVKVLRNITLDCDKMQYFLGYFPPSHVTCTFRAAT